MRKILGSLLLTAITSSCASTPKFDDNAKTVVKDNANAKIVVTTAKMTTGVSSYQFQNATGNAQWIKCSLDKARGSVAVMHRFEASFDPKTFCSGWVAQVFLKKGYQVVTVNRPSYGLTTGRDDLSGPGSIHAIHAGILGSEIGAIEGMWGYDTGVIAATFYAKKYGTGIKWLLLGGGIYDLEQTERSSDHKALKDTISRLKQDEGDVFFEQRSIAWDFEGLPKVIGIYHASEDTFVPINQTEAFIDKLRASEVKVFRNDIGGSGHEIPWQTHFSVTGNLLNQVIMNNN